ncbi:hypothetical protein [Pseudomonas sp. MWU12-2029]|uniref:hypothetical protein n=1 Tax=Pseudomonas sp. MWU12-2029 TaxID=2927805 RepID=UPI00200E7FDC|nr:hypothetical protein [Pseudomonas sp. MWU12-2029]
MANLTRLQLIESILAEMDRVWGMEGFGGEFEAYAWLKENFEISEEEDVQWQDILSDWAGTLDEDIADLGKDEIKKSESVFAGRFDCDCIPGNATSTL